MTKRNTSDDIDDKILSKIPGLEDDDDVSDSGVENEHDEQDQEDEGDTSEEADTDDEHSGDDGADQSAPSGSQQTAEGKGPNATDRQQQQPAQPQQLADPNKPQQVRVDKNGNLVNAQGQIVARAGSERRLYEKSARLETQLKQEKTARQNDRELLQRAATEIKGMREVYGMANDLRMSTREAMMGLTLVDKFKKDPVDFFKYVLTQMAAIGQDVSKLAPELGAAAVSPDGIKQLIQQELRGALGPVRETREQDTREQRAIQDAEVEYTAFVERFPDVTTHEDVIARLIQDDEHLSLDAAYYKLKSFAAEQRLDFSRPLKPQIEARQRSGNTQNNSARNVRTQQRPMPNGRANAPVVSSQPRFSADSSYEDIIMSSLRENGIAR